MATLTLTINEITEADLKRLSAQEGREASDYAARLLARAVRAARPKTVHDIDALKAVYAEFSEEDMALSEATVAEHAKMLDYEDHA